MTNIEKLQSYIERIEHSSTMRRLDMHEQAWLEAAEALRASVSDEERKAWDEADYF